MTSLFGRGMPNRGSAPVPQPGDVSIQAARDATAQSAAASYGRAATIATSGQGATTAAPVAKKTLLGGAGG